MIVEVKRGMTELRLCANERQWSWPRDTYE